MPDREAPIEGETDTPIPHYFGIGCFSVAGGFAGGGMVAVLIGKFVGAAMHCPADSETGAPCHWFEFWFFGAIIGAIVLPTIAIILLRRGRKRAQISDKG